jgi:hypothetical protein
VKLHSTDYPLRTSLSDETPANYSRYLLLSTMSGGTTLQPTIRCPLYLAKLQLTICSIFFTLLSPAVQHNNRQLYVLNGILSDETRLKPITNTGCSQVRRILWEQPLVDGSSDRAQSMVAHNAANVSVV